MKLKLTDEEIRRVGAFVKSLRKEHYTEGRGWWYEATYPITREQIDESYQSWARGGHAWDAMEQGGTGILSALCWYQHVHKPGSREWRPSIIIRALLNAAALPSPGREPQ